MPDPTTPAAPVPAPTPQQQLLQAAASAPGASQWMALALTLLLGVGTGGGLFTVAGDRETAASVREVKAELAGELRTMSTKFESELRALSSKVDDASRRTASIEVELKELKSQVTALLVSRWTREDQDRFKQELDRRIQKLEDELRTLAAKANNTPR